MKFEKIIWQGEEYVLCSKADDYEGDDKDGPIATVEQFNEGELGPAHLFPDGQIRSYGEAVGTREDITFTGVWVEMDPDIRSHLGHMFDFFGLP